MKQLIKLGLLCSLIHSTSIFALNPVNGFYFGLFGEVSHGPSNSQVSFREDGERFDGTVAYSSISGGGGLMLGYKYLGFRGEGEFLFNRISTGPVTVGSCTIQNANVSTPTGLCAGYDDFSGKGLGYKGNSSATFGLFNAYWDFFNDDPYKNMFPYLGAGLGYSYVKNGSEYVNTNTGYSHGSSIAGTGIAYQGIVGLGYHMDDFAWCAMDLRYLSTNLKAVGKTDLDLGSNLPSKAYSLISLNISVSAAFDGIKS